MAWRTTSPRINAFASSAISQKILARSKPKRFSSQITSRRRPEWIWPPFRPEAPLATLFASMSTTSAPASARCSAAERPVNPPPTTQTSARLDSKSGEYSGTSPAESRKKDGGRARAKAGP